jgi:peptidoglycan/xylan/chitin deacetylase (PgdA/CDA1 family)
MLHSLARIAVNLKVDDIANTLVEHVYKTAPRASSRFSRRFQIVTYHKVSPDTHEFFEPTHPVIFEQQMKFLKQCYNVMALSEMIDRSRRGEMLNRAVAITFDDGYRDNYEFALPILKKYELPATIFLATGVIGTRDVLWHDRIFDAFRFATVREAAESRQRSLRCALDRAKALHGDDRRRWIENVEQTLEPGCPPEDRPRMLSWDQVREMQGAGIEFGSHTVTHSILSRVPREELYREIRDSKQRLVEEVGSTVVSFAYPNGKACDYNDEVKGALKECGYAYAVTTQPGFNSPFSDLFELKRGQPWQKEIEHFRLSFFLQRYGLAS